MFFHNQLQQTAGAKPNSLKISERLRFLPPPIFNNILLNINLLSWIDRKKKYPCPQTRTFFAVWVFLLRYLDIWHSHF